MSCGQDYGIHGEEPHKWETSIQSPYNFPDVYQTDSFKQDRYNPVDILFLVDKSGSMVDDRDLLTLNIWKLTDILDENRMDYRLGVSSIDKYAGKFLATVNNSMWVSWVDPIPAGKLEDLINVAGGGREEGNDALRAITSGEGYENNRPFFRFGIPLHIIVISDEEDQSYVHTPQQTVRWLNKLWGFKNAAVTYSAIIGLENSEFCPYLSLGYIGSRYQYVAQEMGGYVIDICNPDWSDSLEDIAHLASYDRRVFALTKLPVDGTLLVYLHSAPYVYELLEGKDYLYDPIANTITLLWEDVDESDVLTVKYQVRN